MFAADIMKTTTGIYAAAGGKAVPANQFGNGGDLYVYEVTSAASKKIPNVDTNVSQCCYMCSD